MFRLIAVFAIGFSAAGLVLLAFRAFGRRAPKTVYLTAAGMAMLGYAIWDEYTWEARTRAVLPERIEIVDALPARTPFQPWTYFFPRVNRLVAVDPARAHPHPKLADHVVVEVLLIERLEPTRTVAWIVDCANGRLTTLAGAGAGAGAGAAETGLPADPAWRPVARDGRLFAMACGPRS